MKKINLLFFIYCFSILSIKSDAKIPSYDLIVKNFETAKFGGNSIIFDIYLVRTGTEALNYAGGQYFFDFNSLVANGGVLTYLITSSDLPPQLQPRNPTIVNNNDGTSRLGLGINPFPGSSNGYYLAEGLPGKRIISMELQTTADHLLIRYDDPWGVHMIDLRLKYTQTPVDSTTQVYSYIGFNETNITNPSHHFIDSSGLRVYPVELISFTSGVLENKVTLSWSTASELNNSGFEIQRKFSNEENWKSIGYIIGFGTTDEHRNYAFIDKVNTGSYNYRLKQIDYNGNYEFFYLNNNVIVGQPGKYKLSQNYPNPFNPSTTLQFEILKFPKGQMGLVRLTIYNSAGNEVQVLVNEDKPPGFYVIEWNATGFPSGVYFYKLWVSNPLGEAVGNLIDTKRMILLK